VQRDAALLGGFQGERQYAGVGVAGVDADDDRWPQCLLRSPIRVQVPGGQAFWPDHDDRAGRLPGDGQTGGSEQQATETAESSGSHDQEFGVRLRGEETGHRQLGDRLVANLHLGEAVGLVRRHRRQYRPRSGLGLRVGLAWLGRSSQVVTVSHQEQPGTATRGLGCGPV
jgi:hypothetical protein